jgi:predicted nuclease with RNAse H fold/dephospho-CoA kinase
MDARPHVVSIDSPLSLPMGRVRVTDDDPARGTAGIVRICERVLRQRGVNVYPCLLPSMQRLTERGMRLAAYFRGRGIPTIESYPGAAQDILGIPRKRASIDHLREGLRYFGIQGDWIRAHVRHDELDAITAALVGAFFWAGRFEGLGSRDEGLLIVPDLRTDSEAWRSRKVIGFSGPIGAGKSTAARILEQHGFASGRFSAVLEQILNRDGIRVTRQSLQDLGDRIHREPGQRWLCEQLVAMLPKQGNIVIDGLRHPEDHSFLVEEYGPAFEHVYIDAPVEIRRQRYVSRGGTLEDFVAAAQHDSEAGLGRLDSMAHRKIENAGDPEKLRAKVLQVVGIQP